MFSIRSVRDALGQDRLDVLVAHAEVALDGIPTLDEEVVVLGEVLRREVVVPVAFLLEPRLHQHPLVGGLQGGDELQLGEDALADGRRRRGRRAALYAARRRGHRDLLVDLSERILPLRPAGHLDGASVLRRGRLVRHLLPPGGEVARLRGVHLLAVLRVEGVRRVDDLPVYQLSVLRVHLRLFSLLVIDRPVAKDDAVGAVEAAVGVGVPREPRAVASDDVALGRDLLDLLDGLVVDPDVHEVRALVEVLRRELRHRAEPKLAQFRTALPDVAPAGVRAQRRVLLERRAILVRAIVADAVHADHDLLQLRAVGEVPLPLPLAVGADVPFEVHRLLEGGGLAADDLPAVVHDGDDRSVVGVLRLSVEEAKTDAFYSLDRHLVLPVELVVVRGEDVAVAIRMFGLVAVAPVDHDRRSARRVIGELELEPGGRGHVDLDHRATTALVPNRLSRCNLHGLASRRRPDHIVDPAAVAAGRYDGVLVVPPLDGVGAVGRERARVGRPAAFAADVCNLRAVNDEVELVVIRLARRPPLEGERTLPTHRRRERGAPVVRDAARTSRTRRAGVGARVDEPRDNVLGEEREVLRRADVVDERIDVDLPLGVELRHAGLAAVGRLDFHAALGLGEPALKHHSGHRRTGERSVPRPKFEGLLRLVEVAAAGIELDLHVDVDPLAVHDEDALVGLGERKHVHADLALEHVLVYVLEGDRLARRRSERHLRDFVGGDDEPHKEVPHRALDERRHGELQRIGRRHLDPRHGAVG